MLTPVITFAQFQVFSPPRNPYHYLNLVINYIRRFYQQAFSVWYFLLVAIMLAIAIYFNYAHGLEARFIAGGDGGLLRFARFYLFYLLPFSFAFLIQPIFFNNAAFLRVRWFWAILLLAPAFFALRVNTSFQEKWIFQYFADNNIALYRASINWVVRVFVLLLPVCIIWWMKDRAHQPLYGFRRLHHLAPYATMVLIMIPMLAMASTQPDFLSVYPKAKILHELPLHRWQDALKYGIFELCYGFDFFGIELFFRGFLILALVKICGPHCIVPAACFYCMIHFGKPMAEAISSFFGGLLLGIIAYNTKSIWGGLVVHLGIAWLMELGGFLGNQVFKTV